MDLLSTFKADKGHYFWPRLFFNYNIISGTKANVDLFVENFTMLPVRVVSKEFQLQTLLSSKFFLFKD